MKQYLAVLMALFVTPGLHARIGHAWSYAELNDKATLIVIAIPTKVTATSERTALPNLHTVHNDGAKEDVIGAGVETTFEVLTVLKGERGTSALVLHHFTLAHPKLMIGEPQLVSFEPKAKQRYLMFLQREPDGRYAPLDQVDPAQSSILKLSGNEWDNMTPDSFKNWMDAKRWLREGPKPGSAISPEITSDGNAEGSLHEAAMNGKLEKAKVLLRTDPALVFSHASYGRLTPLQFAVQYGHKDVAELLLANKADVEAKSYGGWTPLLNAVFGGHKDLVQLLLRNKADVNYQEDAGRSPLHVAAENGHTEITALLVLNKAEVNARNRDGDTPLHIAAAFGPIEMVELLLANKAEINAKDNSSRTPLGFAVLHNQKVLAEWLRQHGAVE